MSLLSPAETLEVIANKGKEKTTYSLTKLCILGILGGVYISFGYLTYIRIIGTMPLELGSLVGFIGAIMFPLGLLAITFAGAELLTGNMLIMFVAYYTKKIKLKEVLYNLFIITIANFIGGILVAYFFGHFIGFTEGDFLHKTLAVAMTKIKDAPFIAFVSGIGCNIFVTLSIWMSTAIEDSMGKITIIWFMITSFVTIGFQHTVANMFIIPAAIFSGGSTITWFHYLSNAIPVYLGNFVGGAIFIGLSYFLAYGKELPHNE